MWRKLRKNILSLLGYYSKEDKSIKDAQGSAHALEWIYKDKLGNNWYKLKNFPVLPAMRKISVDSVLSSMEYGMTPERQIKMLRSIIQEATSSKPANEKLENIIKISTNIMERQTLVIEPEIYKELIKNYLFIEGEGEKIQEQFMNKKLDVIRRDKEAFFFFTALLFNAMHKQANISVSDIRDYWGSPEIKRILSMR